MRYYSDLTQRMYNSAEECEKAEIELKKAEEKKAKEIEQKTAARKEKAAKVDAAYKALCEARKNYEKVLSDFCKDYGAYHKTIKKDDFIDLFDLFRF